MLKREKYETGMVPGCSIDTKGAVRFVSSNPFQSLISGGVEIQFRGGSFVTNDEDAIAMLDASSRRGSGVFRADLLEDGVKPENAADVVAAAVAKEVVADGKAAASIVKKQ